jgi:hypothetical protein
VILLLVRKTVALIVAGVITFRMGEIVFDGTPEVVSEGERLKKIFLV